MHVNTYTSSVPYSRKFLHDKIFTDGSKSKSVKILSRENLPLYGM